jgi:serine/threonine-protein kinase
MSNGSASRTVTHTAPSANAATPSSYSSDIDEGRFSPGTLLNQRYRIINLIGRGGMGEVYRATDLILGQPVALKFLPAEMARDESALYRFRNEVRVARQVSHANVCRVYDLGEADGHPYLSMEYVDGEDLASLLKRIGRLPQDKGVEISRQLCAGLAAAHDKGVLHRDLKPSNILLNSKGQVSITDFGLAGLVEQVQADVRSGTPAYMAPEQLAGLNVTARSDIYALGLVLYEIFSGRRAHDASTRAELQRMKESGSAPSLGSVVKDLDPSIERVIERCLQPDPSKRPASPLQVSAALPGGDPLAAALAAGETPTPEMVAQAGGSESMAPWAALALVVVIVAAWFAAGAINARISLLDRIPFELPPDAIAQKAKEALAELGYADKPADTVHGFALDRDSIGKLNEAFGQHAWHHISHIRPTPVYFWYRTSPQALWPWNDLRVRANDLDPPMVTPGMRRVLLDSDGRLRALLVLPRSQDEGKPGTYAWDPLFRLAGADGNRFQPAEPMRVPTVSYDQRAAWTGTLADDIPHRFRIEAAAFRGKPVYFILALELNETANTQQAWLADLQGIGLFIQLIVFAFALWLAWRNFKAGRGDGIRARHLGVITFCSFLLTSLLRARYTSAANYSRGFLPWVAIALFVGVVFGTMYLAFEPYVRRRWPRILISWSRALSGKLNDPMVGRHILIGIAVGLLSLCVRAIGEVVHNGAKVQPVVGDLQLLLGVQMQIGMLLTQFAQALGDATFSLFIVFALRMVLRKEWLAALGTAALITGMNALWQQTTPMAAGIDFGMYLLFLVFLLRFGYLVAVIVLITETIFTASPPDLHFSAWYAGSQTIPILVLAAATLFGYFAATAGRKVLDEDLG